MPKRSEYRYINQYEEYYFCHEEDMKCVRKAQELAKPKKKPVDLKTFEETELEPKFFVELSDFQKSVVNYLLKILDYDNEGKKIVDARRVLKELKIEELPSNSQLKEAVNFSEGNDIAFFWYLFERVYSQEDELTEIRDFTSIEKILLSCVCHLDMMSTLRELDNILPPGKKKLVKPKKKPIKKQDQNLLSPYLRTLPKPKIPGNKKEVSQKPTTKYQDYMKYSDPSYVIKNEKNRWFVEENLTRKSGEVVVMRVLEDTLKSVVTEASSFVTYKNENFVDDGSKMKIPGNSDEPHTESSSVFDIASKEVDAVIEVLFDRREYEDMEESEASLRTVKSSFMCQCEDQASVKASSIKACGSDKSVKFVDCDFNKVKCCILTEILKKIYIYRDNPTFVQKYVKCLEVLVRIQNSLLNSEDEKLKELATKRSEISDTENQEISDKYLSLIDEKVREYGDPNGEIFEEILNCVKKRVVEGSMQSLLSKVSFKTDPRSSIETNFFKSRLQEIDDKTDLKFIQNINNPEKCFLVLQKGIEFMKKDPKFVLVTLPGAEKLSVLREWVLHRYSFKYISK